MSGGDTHWSGVQVRHLAAFTAVHRHRSFREAASSLGYVQSAVSQQVRRLEEIVGVRLIERARGATQVSLTPAGEVFLEHVEAIMSRLHVAQADLTNLSNGMGARLRVGLFQGAPMRLVPAILSEVAIRHPGDSIVSRESASEADLFALVKAGELDVAFGDVPLQRGPFESAELLVDPCVLLVHADSSLGRSEGPPTLREIAEQPLIRQPRWRMAGRIEMELRSTGVEPEFVSSCDTTSAVQTLVAARVGAAIVRRLDADLDHPSTRMFVLDSLPPTRLALFWHSGRDTTPGLRNFCQAARRVAARRDGTAADQPISLARAAS